MLSYTVKPGDNLTKIASAFGLASWKDLWTVNPDIKNPNVIKPGQVLTVPVEDNKPAEAPPAGSLEKTLPPLNQPIVAPEGTPTLPSAETPQLDTFGALRMALKKTSEIAYSKNLTGNLTSAFDKLKGQGIQTSGISGQSVGNLIDFIEQRTKELIQETGNATLEALSLAEKNKNTARDDARSNLTQINNLISNSGKSWDQVPEELKKQITILEQQAGMPVGIMAEFVKSKPKANLLATTQGTDASGNDIISFVYADENGNPGVVQTIKTGGKSKPPGSSGSSKLTPEQVRAMKAKARTEIDNGYNRTENGFLSRDVYQKLRKDWGEAGGDVTDFDEQFALDLSPEARAALGVGKAAGVKATDTSGNLFE